MENDIDNEEFTDEVIRCLPGDTLFLSELLQRNETIGFLVVLFQDIRCSILSKYFVFKIFSLLFIVVVVILLYSSLKFW